MNLNEIALSFENATVKQVYESLLDGVYKSILVSTEMVITEGKTNCVLIWNFLVESNGKEYPIKKRNHLNSDCSVQLLKTELSNIGIDVSNFKSSLQSLYNMKGKTFIIELKTQDNYQSVYLKSLVGETVQPMKRDDLQDLLKNF